MHSSKSDRKQVAGILIVVFLTVILLVSGCASRDSADEESLDPPAAAVDELLNLRHDRSVDASAYAELLQDPALAIELAKLAQEESQSVLPPIPAWEPPYVSVSGGDAADVIVVWVEPEAFGDTPDDLPAANVFKMAMVDGVWLTGDAFPLARDEIQSPVGE
ncbi:MAG: hypothetical protein PF636_09760 [Actinomycetota bacterium]|jgi:hypothetical protein|nr:hypothetical protein [Actinomycetota bacterium]